MDLHSHLSQHLFSLVNASSGGGSQGGQGPCMKALLADPRSLARVSLCCPQSAMMDAGVYLFQTLEHNDKGPPDRLAFLTCVALVEPSASALSALQAELRRPQFGRYHIYLTGHVGRARIKALAEADVYEVVADIAETPIGYLPLEPHLFVLQPGPCEFGAKMVEEDGLGAAPNVEGIFSLLSSLRMRPRVAYSKQSDSCRSVADQLEQRWTELVTSEQGQEGGNITLVLMDRGRDLITPLLMQWTYQAMIQEIFGIRNGVVDLSEYDVPADLKKVVLASTSDNFFHMNMYKNFGDIGETVRQLVQDYQNTVASHQQIESIGDIRDFVSSYPEFKKITGTVTKHVSLISELSKIVSSNHLLTLSEFEQNLVCGQESDPFNTLKELLSLPNLRKSDVQRLICLYALRGPEMTTKDLAALCEKGNVDRKEMSDLIRLARKYSHNHGSSTATDGSSFSSAGQKFEKKTKSLLRGLRGVDNVYTQHEPLIKKYVFETVNQRFCSDLEYTKSFAFANDVLIYIVGGITYEESRWIQELNKQLGSRVMLGGDCMWSAKSFLQNLQNGRG